LTKTADWFIFYFTMVQSMTGYGRAENNAYCVEIRSINHRYLEIFMRIPPLLSQIEMPLRNLLKGYFARGKFDVTISIAERASAELIVNSDLVKKVMASFRGLQEELSIKGEIDVNTLVGLHDMFIETKETYDADALTEVFTMALEDLLKMRTREGQTLVAELLGTADSLQLMNERAKGLSSGTVASMTEKFNERLKTLLEGREPDANRILLEAAIIAAKMDISEEVARIESHITQFREILLKGGIIGRKLDFLLQELNREVNTIASKSTDYGLASLTVDMKAEIEKLKEQIQNIQ
jgi:uncharacterized protein (TIGR00255 family)